MKLRIEDITAEAKELSFEEPQGEVNRVLDNGPVHEYRVEGPIGVEISYYRAGPELFFRGALHAPTHAVCARCAEEFDQTSERDFRFVLTPKAIGYDDDNDAEGLELSIYEGDEVDLSPLIREQLLLSLPTRPLCREDCRGLCPRCGANLNLTQCGCAANDGDPRLSALRKFIVRS